MDNVSNDYDPSSFSTFTYIYGKGEDYADNEVGGFGRRRLGSTQLGENTRDYTVFTVNWMGSGARLSAGQMYSNRGFYSVGNLASTKSTAEILRDNVVIDKINYNDWTPRAVGIYKHDTTFDVVPVTMVAGGATTTCLGESSATNICEGLSTPRAGHVPFFYVTCGSSTYLGVGILFCNFLTFISLLSSHLITSSFATA